MQPKTPWVEGLHDLGAVSGARGATDYPGVIYLLIREPLERVGGVVATSGDAVSLWVGEFLSAPQQADVRVKLRRSQADERHAFVILPGFNIAPFGVNDLLWREDGPLPTAPPALPEEITHVWLVATWRIGRGLRWSRVQGWQSFATDVPVE